MYSHKQRTGWEKLDPTPESSQTVDDHFGTVHLFLRTFLELVTKCRHRLVQPMVANGTTDGAVKPRV